MLESLRAGGPLPDGAGGDARRFVGLGRHFRRSNSRLAGLLDAEGAACHQFVIGEIALGHLKQRSLILDLLEQLPAAPVVSHQEVLALVEHRGLAGRGIGWIDAHLLASALAGNAKLWTLDRRLSAVARELGIAA